MIPAWLRALAAFGLAVWPPVAVGVASIGAIFVTGANEHVRDAFGYPIVVTCVLYPVNAAIGAWVLRQISEGKIGVPTVARVVGTILSVVAGAIAGYTASLMIEMLQDGGTMSAEVMTVIAFVCFGLGAFGSPFLIAALWRLRRGS